jgi:hypothetical protein
MAQQNALDAIAADAELAGDATDSPATTEKRHHAVV